MDTKCGLERFYSEVLKKKVWGRKTINHGAIILLWKSWQMLQKSLETWWKKTEGKKTKSFFLNVMKTNLDGWNWKSYGTGAWYFTVCNI